MSNTPQDFAFAARDAILNMTLIETFGFGVYSMVFWFTICILFTVDKEAQRTARRMSALLVIIPLYVLAVIHLAIRWTVTRQAFVVDGDTATDILNSFLTQPGWCVALSVVSFVLMTLIADFVTVWRCWIIWNCNWRAVTAPLLIVLVGMAFCIVTTIFQLDPKSGLTTANFNKSAKFSVIYFTLSLCSTAISTILIVYRIFVVSRETGFDTISPYRKVLEIIVESAVLYCIILVVYLPFVVRGDFSDAYAQGFIVPITGIAPTMITARVSLGIARDYTVSHSDKDATATTVSTSFTFSRATHNGNPATVEGKKHPDFKV